MKNYFRDEVIDSSLYHVAHASGVKLNQNECPWDIPIDLKVSITERLIKTDWNRYPVEDLIVLQKKIAKKNNLLPDQIVIANGSNVLIQALVNIIPQTVKVLILDPTFVVYEHQAVLHGNKVIKVPLSENFELLAEKTLTVIKKEKPGLIFIANPNAPTGSLFEKRNLYRIIQAANCPVVIDEAYYPFTAETVIDWLADFDNLIILRTLSKAMALAGIRFGYMMSSIDIAQQVEKFLMPFRLSKIVCVIADEILEHDDYMQTYVKDIVRERGILFAKMQKIEKITVFPSEANFLLFRVENASQIAKRLIEEKVLIRNVGNEDMLKDCLRVSIGTAEENELFLAALKKVLAESV